MKKYLLIAIIALLPLSAPLSVSAAPSGVKMMDAETDPFDKNSLQRGAALFANYCMACHEAKLIRYNRIGKDLGLSDDLVQDFLMFRDDAQLFDGMTNAMTEDDAREWFGAHAPDLSLTARRHGPNWIYTFLNSFYEDEARPHGVNNLLLVGTSMPHVLQELQGLPRPVMEEVGGEQVITGLDESANGALMTTAQYRTATRDITNFLDYVAEPIKADRQRLGVRVILFLLFFLAVAYLLKREYWKDVH